MVDKGDLQFNVGFESWWGPGIPHRQTQSVYFVRCEEQILLG